MAHNALQIIDAADIGDAPVLGAVDTPAIDLDKLPDGVVSGTTLIDFSNAQNPDVRSSVSLAMLFASRVASQKHDVDQDDDAWLATYTESLNQLGFSVSGYSVVNSKFKKSDLSVHKAIIPFLTIAFGGAAAGPIILSLLENLESMNDSPWITLFDKNTRRYTAREMHFAAVSSDATTTSIRYAVARISIEDNSVQVLFFKLKKVNAEFESATTTMTCDNSLLAMVEPALRTKLFSQISTFIGGADVGG